MRIPSSRTPAYFILRREVDVKINNLMKYLKLFENFTDDGNLETLRSAIDPDEFFDDMDPTVLEELAIETARLFGLMPSESISELIELGLIDHSMLIKELPLDEVIRIYYSVYDVQPDALDRVVEDHAGLFSRSVWGLLPGPAAEEIESIGLGEMNSILVKGFKHRETGVIAVRWDVWGTIEWFMLKGDVANK